MSLSVHSALQHPDSIRLILIHAGDPAAELKCSISEIRLPSAPPYEAISYTWGSADEKHRISCGSKGKWIWVTSNCESMMRRLRYPKWPRLVWIDAICIDQSNVQERNAQVQMMGQIYQCAKHVIIDVGETSKDSDHAIDAILYTDGESMYSMGSGLRMKTTVAEFYNRPWFKRVWVLQEAFMAKEAIVMCGTRLVPWAKFTPKKIWVDAREAWEKEPWHMSLPNIVPQVSVLGTHRTHSYTAQADFLSLLCKGRVCLATDPRDKVFAILPMLADAKAHNLEADYNKKMVQVFTEIATWLASKVGISFLSCANRGSKISGLPSWVPDWSAHFREEWMIGLGGKYYPLLAAGYTKAVTHTAFASNGAPLLEVRGIVVDTIRTLSNELNIRSQSKRLSEFVAQCRSWKPSNSRQPIVFPPAKFWRPRVVDSPSQPPDWAARDFGLPLESPMDLTDNDMVEIITYFCVDRQLLLTERGYFGLAPGEARVGDTVSCLLGCGVPFILRRSEACSDNAERYELIGESYIYGLMEGEGLEGVEISNTDVRHAVPPLKDFCLE